MAHTVVSLQILVRRIFCGWNKHGGNFNSSCKRQNLQGEPTLRPHRSSTPIQRFHLFQWIKSLATFPRTTPFTLRSGAIPMRVTWAWAPHRVATPTCLTGPTAPSLPASAPSRMWLIGGVQKREVPSGAEPPCTDADKNSSLTVEKALWGIRLSS